MNRYIFLFLIAAFSLLLHAKCVAQKNIVYGAGITYTVGIPTFVPPGNSSRVAIDTVTSKWYEYAQAGGWRWSGDRVQDISGCSAPAYTPGKAQSRLVLNACTEAQNGHGPELYKYTGSAWLCLNCGGNYTAGDGIDITGTEITNTAPDQVVSITGAGINAITGTYPNFTVTGTEVDGSVTNELQTLSISNDTLSISDGNSVVLPGGGGVAWPLLAPNGTSEAPSYSFEDNQQNGLFQTSRSLVLQGSYDLFITTIEAIEEPAKGIFIKSGNSEQGDGGPFEISAGNSVDASGGTFVVSAGNSEAGAGGTFVMTAGSGANGGGFTMNAGSANSNDATNAGNFEMYAGSHSGTDGTGGTFTLVSGSGEYAGPVSITAGTGVYNYGKIFLEGGAGATPGVRGAVEVNNRLRLVPITVSVRNSISDMEQGDTIMCSNCTATDGSTGVLQTYNGTTWKNHW